MPFITIRATRPCLEPPAWALLERLLLDQMSQAVQPFLRKYTHEDGRLIWETPIDQRNDGDDFYEPFYNWPLLYLLGGADDLLPLSRRQYEAITQQLTALGNVQNGYMRGCDQFHQGEAYIFFYFLCLADPTNPALRDLAVQYAGLYLNDDPGVPNYDSEHNIVRAPMNGSAGPLWGYFAGEPIYAWRENMRVYGLPFSDVPEVQQYDDLRDPILARRMGEAMEARFGKGDVIGNLIITSLVTNAYLMTGEERYRQWVMRYVDGWWTRAADTGGLLPDNVGLSGVVGEYLGGSWYGGLYGWTWPHGFYNVMMLSLIGAANAMLITQDRRYMEVPRTQFDRVMAQGQSRDVRIEPMSLRHHWAGQFKAMGDQHKMVLVPYRYGDEGWFDYQPMSPIYPVTLWSLTHELQDWERIEQVRTANPYDWNAVVQFHSKEDAGHEPPWIRYLAGDNPHYPEQILRQTYAEFARRLALIAQDKTDMAQIFAPEVVGSVVHHWQQMNPVSTEAFVQLMLGAPQIIYNGGLLHCQVRYFDHQHKRAGLPRDVASLVEQVTAQGIVVRLINLHALESREVLVQAGAFGEHRFDHVSYEELAGNYPFAASFPGSNNSNDIPPIASTTHDLEIDSPYLLVQMAPASEILLVMTMSRFVNQPSYAMPWSQAD